MYAREDARGGSGRSIDSPKFCLTKGKNSDFRNFSKSVVPYFDTPEKNS